jgi:3D (Asp-Asp-Asp) domain-containing protein
MRYPLLVAALLASSIGCTQPKPRADVAPLQVLVTAYCVSGTTKSGEQTRPGIVAADPRVLPLGTTIRVEGLPGSHDGTYTVADTGAAVKGETIDIYMKDCSAARRFGRQQAQVFIEQAAAAQD